MVPTKKLAVEQFGSWWQKPRAVFCSQGDCAHGEVKDVGKLGGVKVGREGNR
jgi:hypothetical protein